MRSYHFLKAILRPLGLRPSSAILLLGDALTLQLVAALALFIRNLFGPVDHSLYVNVSCLLLLGPFLSQLLGTCQIPSLPPHKEVKQLFLAVSLNYLLVLAVLFMTQASVDYSRAVLALGWFLSVFAVPFVRGRLRKWLCRQPWWGRPVIFLQQGEHVQQLWEELEERPQRGMCPVASESIHPADPEWKNKIAELLDQWPDAMIICFADGNAQDATFVRQLSKRCRSLIFMPLPPEGGHRFWLTPRDIGDSVGLLVRQNLLDERRLQAKRGIDLCITLLAFSLAVPLGLIIALAIRLDSKGTPIYIQTRLGQGGKKIRVFKFRTMATNADALLRDYLNKNPDLCREWKKNQKLRHDPRITRVGYWLRKTSLDELPQLLNVLKGDMSLVGPRPIVENEIARYGDVYKEYALVKPGITGLWQVSGRNNTTYAQRIWLDHYYVTNWSVWMDLWILTRTVPVVLCGNGAY